MKNSVFVTLALVGLVGTSLAGSASMPETKISPDGKSLTKNEMSLVRGSGSACRWGCDEEDTCLTEEYIVNGPGGRIVLTHWYRQIWSPHYECGFAWGGDNCVPGPDTVCNTQYVATQWCNSWDISQVNDVTWTSTCSAP
jgi:hypothetical protein